MKNNIRGYIYVIISTLGFASLPVISTLAYHEDIHVFTLLFSRFFIAALLLWSYVLFKKYNYNLTIAQLKKVCFASIFGYSLAAFALFYAYKYINVSIATLIMFTHPLFIVIYDWIILKKSLTYNKIIAIILAIIGLSIISISPNSTLSFLGLLLSFASSFCYAYYCIAIADQSIQVFESTVIVSYILSFCALITSILCVLYNKPFYPKTIQGVSLCLLLGVIGGIVPALAFYKGIKLIGASRASIVSIFEPVWVYLIEILFFTHVFNLKIIISSLLVISTIPILEYKPKYKKSIKLNKRYK